MPTATGRHGDHFPILTPLMIKRKFKRIWETALESRTYAELVPLSHLAQSVLNCLFLAAITFLFMKDIFHIVYFEVLLRTWCVEDIAEMVSIFSNSDKFLTSFLHCNFLENYSVQMCTQSFFEIGFYFVSGRCIQWNLCSTFYMWVRKMFPREFVQSHWYFFTQPQVFTMLTERKFSC